MAEDERKRGYAELELAERKYHTIFDNSCVAITVTDQDERIVSWNKYAEHMLGLGKDDFYMRPVRALYPKEEWKRIRSYNVRRKGMQHHLETRMLKKDGSLLDVDISISVLKDPQGKVTGSIGIITDITERKEAELKVELAERKYRSIFDNSCVAITVTDQDERIVSWNKYAEHMLGLGKDDFYMRPVRALYPKEEWKRIRSYNVRRKGMQHHLETRILKKDGSLLDVDISITVLKDPEGRVTGSIGIITDITERKAAEAELARSHKVLKQTNQELKSKEAALRTALAIMKATNAELNHTQDQLIQSGKMAAVGQMSVGIAHEIKNPLAIILQGVECLEREIGPGLSKASGYVRLVKKAAERANRVIMELLAFSRSSELKEEPIDIRVPLEGAISLIRTQSKIESVDISCLYSHGGSLVNADPILMEEVFFNLFINAVEAMDSHGNISIKTYLDGNEKERSLVIEVSDNGKGIPQANLSRIFEPFFTTKEQGKGTGLGLTMVYLILKRHNGSICVKSREGRGAEFKISLPVSVDKDGDGG